MKWHEAFARALDGLPIRRTSWPDGQAVWFDEHGRFRWKPYPGKAAGAVYCVVRDDVRAEDWMQVVGEQTDAGDGGGMAKLGQAMG